MKIILALVIVHCQNYFNYELCVEDTLSCVSTFSAHKPVYSSDDRDVLVGEYEKKLARAFYQCVDINNFEK
jgi:hypothetical protein